MERTTYGKNKNKNRARDLSFFSAGPRGQAPPFSPESLLELSIRSLPEGGAGRPATSKMCVSLRPVGERDERMRARAGRRHGLFTTARALISPFPHAPASLISLLQAEVQVFQAQAGGGGGR